MKYLIVILALTLTTTAAHAATKSERDAVKLALSASVMLCENGEPIGGATHVGGGMFVTSNTITYNAKDLTACNLKTPLKLNIVANDIAKDIAILKTSDITHSFFNNPRNFITINIAHHSPGSKIYVIGSPAGLPNIVKTGIMGAPKSKNNYMILAVTTNKGDTGGGVFNQNGELMGVLTAHTQPLAGLSYAQPAASVYELIGSHTKRVQRCL